MNIEFICLTKTDLAQKIAQGLHKQLHCAKYQQFSDGEVNVTVSDHDQFAGKAVVIVQSTGDPVNEHTLGVAFLAQELKNAGARKVIAVIPYLGYARQERSAISGKPGSLKVVAKLYESSGIDELITIDLHEPRALEFFSIPVCNLKVQQVIADHITTHFSSLSGVCLIAPDAGAKEYVQEVGSLIQVGTLTFSKERFGVDKTRVLGHEGSCSGTTGIMIDDIIATGGTAIHVCDELKTMGYQTLFGYFMHPVLSGNAVENIKKSSFTQIFVSNTLPLKSSAKESAKIAVFDVSAILIQKLRQLCM